ncbi:MAG: sortase [Candidatus Saccharimonadales bacterium]
MLKRSKVLYNSLKWEPNDVQPKTPNTPHRHAVRPPERDQSRQQAAIARLARHQIEAIYDQPSADQPTTRPTYARTHSSVQPSSAEQLQQYHTAWQEYYQKYYEHYYVGQVRQVHDVMQGELEKAKQQTDQATVSNSESISEEEAIYNLRQKLLDKVQTSATKVRKSHHFVPIISATIVMLIFLFLQYNSILIAYAVGYVTPGSIDPQNIIVDPSQSLTVSPEPRLVIPKINVDVNVDYTATPDNASQMKAMQNGVAYFGIPGANSKPGQNGNVPIAGHSSNDFTDTGNGKFIFARLEQLKVGDVFYLNYNGIRYTYTVRETMTVLPSDVSKLSVGTDKPMATLITCTPLGTAQKRFLVFGEQVSPSPSEATQAPTLTGSVSSTPSMAGKSPTLFERLFGAE